LTQVLPTKQSVSWQKTPGEIEPETDETNKTIETTKSKVQTKLSCVFHGDQSVHESNEEMFDGALELLINFKNQQNKDITEAKKTIEAQNNQLNSYKAKCEEYNKNIQNLEETIDDQTAEISDLIEKIQNLKRMSAECKICFSGRIAVALSCGHTLCDNCFGKVCQDKDKKCPFCKQKYLGLQHLFL